MSEKKDASIGWMYEGAKSNVNREDYLLGKKVDKNFEKYSDVVNEEKPEQIDSLVKTRTVVASTSSGGVKKSTLQTGIIRSEDPFVAVRVREETKRRELMDNPLMKMKLQKMLKNMMNKPKKEKKKSKKRRSSSTESDSEDERRSRRKSPSPKRRKRSRSRSVEKRRRKSPESRRRSRSRSVERKRRDDRKRSDDRSRSRSAERKRRDDRKRSDDRSRSRSVERKRRDDRRRSDDRSRSRSVERRRRDDRKRSDDRSRSPERRSKRDPSDDRKSKSRRSPKRTRSRSSSWDEASTSEAKKFDSHVPKHLQNKGRDSSSESSDEDDRRKPEEKEKKQYGLVEMRKRRDSEKEEDSKLPTKEYKLVKFNTGRGNNKDLIGKKKAEPRKKLTDEEKAAKLAEMQENAKWRDDERKKNLTKNKEEAEEEKKELDQKGYAPSFIRNQMRAACDGLTVEKHLQSKKGEVQRNHGYMNQSFARK